MTIGTLSGAELVKKLVLGGSVSAGAVLAYELLEIARRDPKVIEAVVSWGPMFAIAICGMLIVDRRIGSGVEALNANASAQQKLADAVQQIAQRDDERQREMELVIGHLSRNSAAILDHVSEMRKDIDTMKGAKALGHSAG